MTTAIDELTGSGQAARAAARKLARLSTAVKDRALFNIADALSAREGEILAANEKDIHAGREKGLSEAVLERLLLDTSRLEGMAAGRASRGLAAGPGGRDL